MSATPNPLPFTAATGFHPTDCWREPGHHGCAIALLDALGADRMPLASETDEDSWTVADRVEQVARQVAAFGPIPDVPQPSLPLTRTRHHDGYTMTEVV